MENHQEVFKESSLKRSCCMPVCCDQCNDFEYEGHVFKLVFVPWFNCCCMGDLSFCRRKKRTAQNGRTISIIHKALVRDMQITGTSSGPTITKEKRHLAESDRRDLPFTRFSKCEA